MCASPGRADESAYPDGMHQVQEVEDPLMRQIRYLDKLVDELAKGRPMEKVLRTP